MREKNQFKMLKILTFVAIGVMFAATLLAAFFNSFASVAVTIALLAAAGLITIMVLIFKYFKSRIDDINTVFEHCPGYAVVKFDKKDEFIEISPNFHTITGLETNGVVDDVDYQKLMCELISSPSDAGPDIYMAARPESWIRLVTFENDDSEFTIVHDVSEYVSCHNIIKSLKYYDGETGMLCRDAFISKVRNVAENEGGIIGLVSLMIGGVDRISSFKGTSAADKVITKAAAFVKRFENPHNAFAGRTSTTEICMLLTDTYEDGCRKYADKLFYGLSDALSGLAGSEYIRVYCGYAVFDSHDEEELDANSMISSVDYAAYEAKSSNASAPVRFDRANYILKAFDFKKIQVFNAIMADNKIEYHFQPVVDAHTGDIYGYEALMRPQEIDGVRLTPLETLNIAKEHNMLERVEYLTMHNLLKFLSENISFFEKKKLFINTIPNCFISNEAYEEFFKDYSDIFEKIIIEITEGSQITPESIGIMRKRYSSKNALFALDDYGMGYANDSTLLSIQPDLIKIDRSLISGIDTDIQKKHLVTNMINFAKNHGIKVLSEGVETRGELETVISLGIDLVQGFYTGKPNPVIVDGIATDIRNELLDINLKSVGYKRKFLSIENTEPVDVTTLAVNGYTDLILSSPEINIISTSNRVISMCIHCEDGYKGTVRIKDVNIIGLESPVLILGKDCDVTLEVSGNNTLGYEGIRIPETSKFTMVGSGNLKIDSSADDGVAIGGNYLQDFGEIVLNHSGVIDIAVETSNIIAVGGGIGSEKSSISMLSGKLNTELRGINIANVGALSGEINIKLENCEINLDSSGRHVVGIGNLNGKADIECNANVVSTCGGDKCCGIGTLDGGASNVKFFDGKYRFAINAKYATATGAVQGNTNVTIENGEYIINCEGNNAVGIGDNAGLGNVSINGGKMKIRTAASSELGIGSAIGKAVITGGNIIYDGRGRIAAISPNGEVLEMVQHDQPTFSKNIISTQGQYTYTAEAFEGESVVRAYLPVGVL